METKSQFYRDLHIRYFTRCLSALPAAFKSLDTARMMVVYFCCAGLDALDALDKVKKDDIIEWIYKHQVLPSHGSSSGGGFLGPSITEYTASQSHISMTYTALATLTILGDDLSRVNKTAICQSLRDLQTEDGCFQAVRGGSESDTRFVFCAAAISFMLQDWSGIDVDKAEKFILRTQGYDGGFGLQQGLESHGGSTYCGIASLRLMDRMQSTEFREKLTRFLVQRQVNGFNGRVNKPPDTCYTFWVGGAMQVLGCQDFIDRESTRDFLMQCQQVPMGGFSKLPEMFPDPLHSVYGIVGMSLIDEPGLLPIDCVLGITKRAFSSSTFANGLTASGRPYKFAAVPLDTEDRK